MGHNLDSAVHPIEIQTCSAGLSKVGVPAVVDMVEGCMTSRDDPAHYSADGLLS